MTDRDILTFLEYYVNTHPEIPPLPRRFTVRIANPADMGSRGGIMVDQLHVNDQYGFYCVIMCTDVTSVG